MHRTKYFSRQWLLALIVAVVGSSFALASDPSGKWKGEWRSDSTGHHGPLRATVRAREDGTYDARFSGRFAWVVPFTYRATLVPNDQPETGLQWMSQKKLGPFLGSYRMSATTTGNQLHAQFQAGKDSGSFFLQRR